MALPPATSIHEQESDDETHLLTLAAATSLLAGAATGALAQSPLTPGKQFQENSSVSGSAGASGYAPGQQFRTNSSIDGKAGASGYAPGRATTGAPVDSQTGVKAGGAKVHTGIGAGAKAKIK